MTKRRPPRIVVGLALLLVGALAWGGIVALVGLTIEPAPPPTLRELLRESGASGPDGEASWQCWKEVIARSEEPGATTEQFMRYASDPDADVRVGLAHVVGFVPNGAASPGFAALLRDADERVGTAAIEDNGLAFVPQPPAEIAPALLDVAGSRRFVRRRVLLAHAALNGCVGSGSPCYALFTQVLFDADETPERRLAAAVGLRTLTRPDKERVLDAVASGDEVTAEVCLVLLPTTRDDVSPAALARLGIAIREQGRPLVAGASPRLVRLRERMEDIRPFVPVHARHVVRLIGSAAQSVAPALRDRLLACRPDTAGLVEQRECVAALAATTIRLEDVTPELLRLRNHSDPEVRSGVRELVEAAGYRDP